MTVTALTPLPSAGPQTVTSASASKAIPIGSSSQVTSDQALNAAITAARKTVRPIPDGPAPSTPKPIHRRDQVSGAPLVTHSPLPAAASVVSAHQATAR